MVPKYNILSPEEHLSINALVWHGTNNLQGQPSNPDTIRWSEEQSHG